jgi:hypothetical protein
MIKAEPSITSRQGANAGRVAEPAAPERQSE